ncbi:hypothetical protein ACSBR2_004865 [Camellia fascicularis]
MGNSRNAGSHAPSKPNNRFGPLANKQNMHSPVDKQKGKRIQGAHATITHKTVSEVAHKTLSQEGTDITSDSLMSELVPSIQPTSMLSPSLHHPYLFSQLSPHPPQFPVRTQTITHPQVFRPNPSKNLMTLNMSDNSSNAAMKLVEVQLSKMTHSAVGSYLEPESEAIHQVGIVWWIDEIQLNIEPRWQSVGRRPLQATQMAALRPSVLNKKLVCDILGLNPSEPLLDLPNRLSMNIMLWNCRGTGNKNFRRHFKELIRTHRPDVVALFETKVMFSSMGLFFNNLGYTASITVDPVGRVGGIWLLWIPTQVSVSAFVANQKVIQATVKWKDYEDWVLAVVYASPNIRLQQTLWEDLEDTANSMTKPWLIAGDFNEISEQNERRSFSQNIQHNRSCKFTDNIHRCGLMDLGCTGPKLTWTNNCKGMANTMERLD